MHALTPRTIRTPSPNKVAVLTIVHIPYGLLDDAARLLNDDAQLWVLENFPITEKGFR